MCFLKNSQSKSNFAVNSVFYNNAVKQQSVEELIDEQIFPAQSGMSAREKNRAKRKAKQQARQTTAGYEVEKKNGWAGFWHLIGLQIAAWNLLLVKAY